MIDYRERIEDVADILSSEMGVRDRQAVEILLAAGIECPLQVPWIILDTPFYRMAADEAWFSHLGSTVMALPLLRVIRPRTANEEVQKILRERDTARIFLEPNGIVPPSVSYKFYLWPYLLQECVRLKTPYPKTWLIPEPVGLRLRAAVAKLYDNRWRTVAPVMPALPGPLPYYAEMLQKLAPDVRDWDALINNLVSLAGRLAYLNNRRVESTDWEAVARVMRDTVPPWVHSVLEQLSRSRRVGALKGYIPDNLLTKELTRLVSNGVIMHQGNDWLIRDIAERGQDFVRLISGVNLC